MEVVSTVELVERKAGKELYDYQNEALEQIFERLRANPEEHNLLYQLPTGGGKTVIFSEIAKRYIQDTGKKVLILTHRIELSAQTSRMLTEFAVVNKVITSEVRDLEDKERYMCFVAMVETLTNRLLDQRFDMKDVGLVIVDEAHYNSFRKLFSYFEKSVILGVTATPLSSNIELPMNKNYDELIVGDSIATLIKKGFLARATTYSYDVNLQSLTVGITGDYTVSSSERLYANYLMQEKLLYAYEERAKGKKTLIFNSGIKTSKYVYETFVEGGYEIRHLDNTNTPAERKTILRWFKEKPGAILTSVGILTTGFDEPTVECIILNRATRSLTLYHQMIGRGSRILPNKSSFSVIDLGNNALRFGLWEFPVDWAYMFRMPHLYSDNLLTDAEIERNFTYTMPDELRARFGRSETVEFNIEEEYKRVTGMRLRPKVALENSIAQHVGMCVENATDTLGAKELAALLDNDIEYRVKRYSHCLCKSTSNYLQWLQEDYKRKLMISLSEQF